jgi:hypothetical protein
MPIAKKASTPETKGVRWRATIETKAETQTASPTHWLFESHGAQPLIGIGTEPQAETYVRLLNHHRSLNAIRARPVSAAEAEALAAALPSDAPPIFTIGNEMPRFHIAQPRH